MWQSTTPGFANGLMPVSKENRDLIISDIPGLPPVWALDLPCPFLIDSMYEWMRVRHLKFRKADVILINTFYELEKAVLDALRNEVVGQPNLQVTLTFHHVSFLNARFEVCLFAPPTNIMRIMGG